MAEMVRRFYSNTDRTEDLRVKSCFLQDEWLYSLVTRMFNERRVQAMTPFLSS